MRLLPERRRHWRIVTLKNAAWLAGGLIVLFLALSAWNEVRPRSASRERLYQRGSSSGTPPPARPRPADVVEETPVTDETYAAHRQSGGLLAPPPVSTPAPATVATSKAHQRPTLAEARQRGQRIVVTGGEEGVRVDTAPATATQTAIPPDLF
jgi:hypothetical protein